MPSSIRPGDVLANRYLLIDLLSEAGEGRFWRAHDRVLARHVAIHVIPASGARAAQLLDAARLAAGVPDLRFLRVLDAEQTPGMCYVVNEWGTGTRMDTMLQHAPLSARRAAWMVGEIAASMAAAHDAGITHGRLVPENIMVDLTGSVRVVGLQVDAALSGLPPATPEQDVRNIVAILYAGLTGRWPGASPSELPPAPMEGKHVLRPRQVRAGIPRVLDELCDDVLNAGAVPRAPYDLTTARGVADYLREYVGDPSEVAAAEAERGVPGASALPPLAPPLGPLPTLRPHDTQPGSHDGASRVRDEGIGDTAVRGTPVVEPVVAPNAVTDAVADAAAAGGAASGAAAGGAAAAAGAAPAGATGGETPDIATQAGMPIFDDATDDVSWLNKRSDPPPPPPAFEEPEERPLFAPETPEEIEARRRQREELPNDVSEEFWPWATQTGHRTGAVLRNPVRDPGARKRSAPGRSWLQLAGFLGSLVALLLVVTLVFNLVGRGGDDDTAIDDDPTGGATPSETVETSQAPRLQPLSGLSATSLDPQGDGVEYEELTANVLDGDEQTTWYTSTYFQQFGPGGLKTGVGLQLDLGAAREVGRVDLSFVGAPTSFEVYLTDDAIDDVEGLDPVATETADQDDVQVALEGVSGQYLTVWLTALPGGDQSFRGEIAEVRVLA